MQNSWKKSQNMNLLFKTRPFWCTVEKLKQEHMYFSYAKISGSCGKEKWAEVP